MTQRDFQRYISCFILVTFDSNQGQKISLVVPPIQFSAQRQKQISMLSFPDSNALSINESQGTSKYIFKTSKSQFGYVCFRQKKQQSNPRGFSQQSFVILTQKCFLQFYEKMADFIVYKLLNTPALEAGLNEIIRQMNRWPNPQSNSRYQLPLLNNEMVLSVPRGPAKSLHPSQGYDPFLRHKLGQSLESIVTEETLQQCGVFQEVKLTQHFSDYRLLWEMWQIVILNRAAIILAENAYQASQAVFGAISLLNPIDYAAEYSPYLTVYHPCLDTLTLLHHNHVFGATNPLFFKLFDPKLIRIINLKGKYVPPKHLKPLNQLCRECCSEEQRIFNESSLRKYFYKLNNCILNMVSSYLDTQYNDLKFFNKKEFMHFLKHQDNYDILGTVYTSKKAVLRFFQQFIHTKNFDTLLLKKNAVKKD